MTLVLLALVLAVVFGAVPAVSRRWGVLAASGVLLAVGVTAVLALMFVVNGMR